MIVSVFVSLVVAVFVLLVMAVFVPLVFEVLIPPVVDGKLAVDEVAEVVEVVVSEVVLEDALGVVVAVAMERGGVGVVAVRTLVLLTSGLVTLGSLKPSTDVCPFTEPPSLCTPLPPSFTPSSSSPSSLRLL